MRPSESVNRFNVPGGLHDAICYGVVHVGTIKTEYKGEPKMRDLIYLLYELPEVKHIFSEEKGEEPAVMSKKFTYTYAERGNLLDWIKTWSNNKINKKNINNFDIDKLVGIGCKLQIIQDEGDNGTYCYPKGIISLTPEEKKTINKAALYNPIQIYDVSDHNQEAFDTLYPWLQKVVKESQEYKELGLGTEETHSENKTTEELDAESEDLAF